MKRPTKRILDQELSSLRREFAGRNFGPFDKKCHDWIRQDANQDRRGTKAEAIKRAYYACIWFRQAQRARSHSDSSLRRMANKAVKGVRHQEFPEILENLRKLHGLASKVGKRQADQRREASERSIELTQGYDLRELRSLKSLRAVGRTLRNCLETKSTAREYLKDIRDGDAEIWVLRKQQEPLSLMKVDKSTREIVEFQGEGGSSPELKRSVALAILEALNVDGDDDEAFSTVGAYRVFREGQPDVDPVEADGCLYWIWLMNDATETVIASSSQLGRRRRWSRFSRNDVETTGHSTGRRHGLRSRLLNDSAQIVGGLWNHLSEGDLLGLVLDHPSLAERLRGQATQS